jgi:hypothetical protein
MSGVRDELENLAKLAKKAAAGVHDLIAALDGLSIGPRQALDTLPGLDPNEFPEIAARLECLRSFATNAANQAQNKGGRPKMKAYRELIDGLRIAFERATGRKATITTSSIKDEYSGPFFELTEAVLSVVSKFANDHGKWLDFSRNKNTRGAFIKGMLRTKSS